MKFRAFFNLIFRTILNGDQTEIIRASLATLRCSFSTLKRDPNADIISSIPFTLIAPFGDSGTAPARAEKVRGIAAVGADTFPQDGTGVTVAVLDTSINTEHAALSSQNDELVDFTTNEEVSSGRLRMCMGTAPMVAQAKRLQALIGKPAAFQGLGRKSIVRHSARNGEYFVSF